MTRARTTVRRDVLRHVVHAHPLQRTSAVPTSFFGACGVWTSDGK
ncbi:MAG: hypothetical protein ABIZ70_12645 [Gemmatimonadales bacterium]